MFNCLCRIRIDRQKMFATISEILAPNPTLVQDFDYQWKIIKTFYTRSHEKVHIDDTNIPIHLEKMLQILIKEQEDQKYSNSPTECFEFLLVNRPFDLLVEFAANEQPVGIRSHVLNWMKRFLTCIVNPQLEHASIFQPIQKLVQLCNGTQASPYDMEEILLLEAVSGLIRKDSFLINLFISTHQHKITDKIKGIFPTKPPRQNSLFDESSTKLEPNIRRIELLPGTLEPENIENIENATKCDKVIEDICDCDDEERFTLLDNILSYLESADSTIVVRASEAALILASLETLNQNCAALRSSFTLYANLLTEKLAVLAEQIPDDMDLGDIEEAVVSWGLFPKDDEQSHFVGRYQLTAFLCWLDYSDCLLRESEYLAKGSFCSMIRINVFEKIIEPMLFDTSAPFALVLTAKIVKITRSQDLLDEIATWLTGVSNITDITGSDCLLTILIENAQDNSDILLQTLQLVEALLDNPHERILHSMLFYYVNTRGYYDSSQQDQIESWSDEEENRERRRGSLEDPIKSRTLAPNNILKIINNFLLLLPRQLMSESVGTCYEEYMADASAHYQSWIKKTVNFDWPVEASFPSFQVKHLEKKSPTCSDSGISEDIFYEGPLLRLLFNHVKTMCSRPEYELNLAAIAILSKLALLPHPFLHEILLGTEIPVVPNASTLWSVLTILAKKLLSDIPRVQNFSERIKVTAIRLLTNPPLIRDSTVEGAEVESSKDAESLAETKTYENDSLFEILIILDEFLKELAAIAFCKYHHATE